MTDESDRPRSFTKTVTTGMAFWPWLMLTVALSLFGVGLLVLAVQKLLGVI